MPATSIGPYRILRSLGEGGMGAVYEALHESIERRVALKVLHPAYAHSADAVTRFFNEARAVNRIEHPNIVQVSEFARADDGTVYLVMEYLRGETLSRRLEMLAMAGRRMATIEAVQISAQLADALAAAHEKGIVHRDLKPGNVMLVPDSLSPGSERVKLLDFGIAKLSQGAGGKATKTHAILGTPQYMSPEQCRGAGGVDERTDVYALGVILYEMLAGCPPFVAEEPIAYLAMHAYQPPPPLAGKAPQTPAEVCALVHRLLEKDKGGRPPMRDIRAILLQLLSQLSGSSAASTVRSQPVAQGGLASGGPPSTLGGSLGQTVHSLPKRRPVILATATLAVLIAGSATALLLRKPALGLPTTVVRSAPSPRTEVPPSKLAQPAQPLTDKPEPATTLPATASPTPIGPPRPISTPAPASIPSLVHPTRGSLLARRAASPGAEPPQLPPPRSEAQSSAPPRRGAPATQPASATPPAGAPVRPPARSGLLPGRGSSAPPPAEAPPRPRKYVD
jgi:serine/threonine-protein kinase